MASSDAAPVVVKESTGMFELDRMEFDLSTQLTYMSALSAAGLTRDRLFQQTSELPYTTSSYFRSIRLMTERLNYNYPRACEVVASRSKADMMRSFLLRFAGSLGSGERESDFLARESEVQFESHRGKYDRDLESLRKWTDGFVALEVSVALVVIIAVVSLMIFPLGPAFVLGLTVVGMFIAALGGYVIFRTSPSEVFTHNLRIRSPDQHTTIRMARYLLPVGLFAAAGIYAATGMSGLALLALGSCLLPIGWKALKYHAAIDARDRDTPAFLRAVGGVTAAIGTTVTEAIGKLDLRSMGSLEPEVRRLYQRLQAGIRADLCWERFVSETGSELVRRSVAIFWDGIRAGGDAARTGYFASMFAMHISMLRQKRALVANTFGWLMLPMHATLIALLTFITEIVSLFSEELAKAQSSNVLERPAEAAQLPGQEILAFGGIEMGFVKALVFMLVIVLTLINGWVPNAAAGGDRYRFCFHLSVMLIISGIALTIVPLAVDMIFGGLVVEPTG